ncbi:MAG TPA: YD repeat-containing protein [Cyclobacteriaceae bacterium]|nr:YD repeat-containing protein [Cyclobacteriaceae bacterium]
MFNTGVDMSGAIRSILFIVFPVVLLSCGDDSEPIEPTPSKLIPISFKEGDLTKTLTHNENGNLTEIRYQSGPIGTPIISYHRFVYNDQGRLTASSTDTGWRYEYTYSGELIRETQEYVNGSISDRHTFSYDAKGRLVEQITYQNIPSEGGIIPVAKTTYQYEGDNMVAQRLYYYTSYGLEARLLTEFYYSDFDSMINSEDYFDVIGVNPLLKFSKNNPRKMIVKNGNGTVTSTDTYRYEYHPKGYATSKKVTTKFYHGGEGTYEATYSFVE